MKKIIIILYLFCAPCALADWQGPQEIRSFNWGNGQDQIGFEKGDTEDSFPNIIKIDQMGNIIFPDGNNRRFYLLSANGTFLRTMKTEIDIFGMDLEPRLIKRNILLRFKDDYMIFDYKGKLIKKFKGEIGYEIYTAQDQIYIEGLDNHKYYKYSIDGQFLKTYDTRPLELGMVYRQSVGGGNYETTIEYPDKKWKVKGLCAKYTRDACGILYCVDNAIVIRYDDEGKDVAYVGMPNEKSEEAPAPPNLPPGVDSPVSILEQYGSPILAPNGDVYTWKRTPDKYSIIKWVWVDGPECPQYLDVTPTKTSLKFTWQKPEKDADKVTGYQLLQSYNICGPFRQVVELKKEKLSYEDKDVKKGETYYYIVKAIRGKDYSGNSNKVCGQIE